MKSLGLISILLTWVVLIYVAFRDHTNIDMTFSQHAAQSSKGLVVFRAFFVLLSFLFGAFLVFWLGPTHNLPVIYYIVAVGHAIALFFTAIIPETKERGFTKHRIAAYTHSITMIPIGVIIALSPSFPDSVRVFSAVVSAISAIGIVVSLPHKGLMPKMLPLQAAYIAGFHTVILAATYIT